MYQSFEKKNMFYEKILQDKEVYNILKEDVYSENTVLEKMEKIRNIPKKSKEYEDLYQQIISVGEFPIKST
jgi:hypothetical protein